jgi:hypothetical protein
LSVTASLPYKLQHLPRNNQHIKIIYFDKSWEKWNRLTSTFLAIKTSLASIFNLTPFYPSKTLLFLKIPFGCNDLHEINWQKVWSKEILNLQNTLGS